VVDGDESPPSIPAAAVPSAPKPPTLKVYAGVGLVALSWTASTDPNTSGYAFKHVRRGLTCVWL
jgi:hypothetical protein